MGDAGLQHRQRFADTRVSDHLLHLDQGDSGVPMLPD